MPLPFARRVTVVDTIINCALDDDHEYIRDCLLDGFKDFENEKVMEMIFKAFIINNAYKCLEVMLMNTNTGVDVIVYDDEKIPRVPVACYDILRNYSESFLEWDDEEWGWVEDKVVMHQ